MQKLSPLSFSHSASSEKQENKSFQMLSLFLNTFLSLIYSLIYSPTQKKQKALKR